MRTLILTALAALLLVAGFAGCSLFQKSAEHAEAAVIDCSKGELANLKPIAKSMVKPLVAGQLTWDDAKQTAIDSGLRVGGCLLAHLRDAVPRSFGMVGSASPADKAFEDFKAAVKTTARYRTETGEL